MRAIAAALVVLMASVSWGQADDEARKKLLEELYRGACGLSAVPVDVLTGDGPIAPLLDGMGDFEFPITTNSAEAQRFFNQGVVLAYGFNHGEAARSFRQATVLDPECAMAWWGYAMVLGPNINAGMDAAAVPVAYKAIGEAQRLSAGVTTRERDYISALAERYAEDPGDDRTGLDRAYAEAMKNLAGKYPDDLDAQTLWVESQMDLAPWDYWSADGRARDWTPAMLATLESVMDRNPDHAGACHLYIHMSEFADPWRAEAAADRLSTLAPGAGHLVHMPGHIYIRIGRYGDAAEVNRRASAVDEAYITQCRKQGIYPLAYYPHNVHFLWASATMMGNSGEALASARKLADGIDDDLRGPLQQFLTVPLVADVRFGQWDSILALEGPHGGLMYTNGIWRYARAMAYARTGRADEAVMELDELRSIMDSTDLEEETVFVVGGPRRILEIASEIVAGEIAAASGDHDSAIAHLSRAARLEDGLAYNEPEDWANPARLNLGAVLLEAGRSDEAESVFWRDLEDHPENGWALTGLVAALEAQGEDRVLELEAVRARLAEAWSESDITLATSRF